MSNFVPTKRHLREVLLNYFILKKTAAESHRLLVEAYDEDTYLLFLYDKSHTIHFRSTNVFN